VCWRLRSNMNDFDRELTQRLAALREQGLLRELRRVDSPQSPRIQIAGQTLLNFSSNDYLGLAGEPVLKDAATRAVARYGAGAGASRLICGSLAPHHELDEALAAFKGAAAALSFSTGYAAAIGAISALLGRDDVIVLDKLVHACIVDAARLSGATLRVFAHNDLDDLEAKLKWATAKTAGGKARVLVVTESVFSMDGDHAPLREITALKDQYGAWLMVDEAHATGLYGACRRGLAEELGVSDHVEVQMGTLGKALGAAGGYICGSRAWWTSSSTAPAPSSSPPPRCLLPPLPPPPVSASSNPAPARNAATSSGNASPTSPQSSPPNHQLSTLNHQPREAPSSHS